MSVFQYTAVGSIHRGTVTADSPRQARQQLRRDGIAVEELVEQTSRTKGRPTQRTSSAAKLTAAIRELATLLSAGIGLVEALDVLVRQHRGSFQDSLQVLRDEVASGTGLADAMRQQSHVFDELTIQMTEVGENSGTLDGVLDQLADFKDRSLQFKEMCTRV